jgi:enoyl-CoA hydratase/carnithine racemase
MFSARFMPASEAFEMGLINFIHERGAIESACIDYAKTIANNAPLTVKAAKAAVNAWERDSRDDEVEAVRAMVDDCFNSEDYREGRKAFANKRPPEFKNR